VEYGFARGSGCAFGKSGWAQATYRLVSSGDRSHIIFMQIEDMTKVHSLETEVGQLNRQLQEYMNLMPGGMFCFEADGDMRFARVGKGLLNLLQFDSEEAFYEKFGESFPALVYEPDRQRVLTELKNCAEKEYCYVAHRIERGDGKIGWYYACGHAVRDVSEQTWYYVMIIKLNREKQELFGIHRTLEMV
jgi:PAS domain-containing protein